MKENDIKLGVKLCFENADALLGAADASQKLGHYGIGSSLNILAAEEAIKAMAIFSRQYGSDLEFSDFKKYFIDHKTKHKTIRDLMGIITFFKKATDALLVPILENNTKKEIDVKQDEGLDNLEKWVNESTSEGNNFQKELDWWNSANSRKNDGFYVGLKKDVWSSPKKTTKKTYNKERLYVENLVNEIKGIESILEDDFYSKLMSGMIQKFKDKQSKNE